MDKAWLYKTSSAETVSAIFASLAKDIQDDISIMEGLFIDVSGICAKLPDSMDELIDFRGREDLLEALKRLQGSSGRGLKLFDQALRAMRCAGIDKLDGLPAFTDLRKKAVDTRQKGRLQIVARSGAVICKSDRPEDVQALMQKQVHTCS